MKNDGKKWSWMRVAGLAVAVVMVTFGSLENVIRTVKYWLERRN